MYHCDIVEKTEPAEGEREARTSYEYHEIILAESDNRDTLTRLTIREYYSPEMELKMINESHTATRYTPTDEYKAYLIHRAALIAQVEADWAEHRYTI